MMCLARQHFTPTHAVPTDSGVSCAAGCASRSQSGAAAAGEKLERRLTIWLGRPGRLLAPAPLQIWTCGTTASGSSNHGFAALAALIRYFVDFSFTQNDLHKVSLCFFRRFRDSALRFPPLAPAGDSSPASSVPSECSDFPTSVPPRSLSFARAVPALLLVVRQRGVAVTGSSSELRRCLNPLPSTHTRRDGGISQVPRQPLYEHALLFDPGGPDAPRPLTTHPMLPSVRLTTSSRRSVTFRGSVTRPARSLSTLRGSDYSDWTPRETRFPMAANLVGAGLSPAGLLQEVSTLCFNSHRFPLLVAFPGAPTGVTP
jgi:hypothetical protein